MSIGGSFGADLVRSAVRIWTGLMIGLGTVALAAGCGDDGDLGDKASSDDGSRTDSGQSVDVCSLVTADEAEVWLGGPVIEPVPMEGPSGRTDEATCTYRSDVAETQILLQVYDGPEYHGDADSPTRAGAEKLDAPGDDAFFQNGSVRFLVGDWSVSVGSIQGNIPEADLVAMGEVVEENLP
jgi:hypothetical protein